MNIDKIYEKKVRKILRTYNSILVKCKNIPLLTDKNIIMIDNIDSMINAQVEIRKPILYFQEDTSIAFMLLDGTEAYIYIVKLSDNVQSKVEQIIENLNLAKNTFVKEMLSRIEKMLLNESMSENSLGINDLKYLEGVDEKISNDLFLVPVKKKNLISLMKRKKKTKDDENGKVKKVEKKAKKSTISNSLANISNVNKRRVCGNVNNSNN